LATEAVLAIEIRRATAAEPHGTVEPFTKSTDLGHGAVHIGWASAAILEVARIDADAQALVQSMELRRNAGSTNGIRPI